MTPVVITLTVGFVILAAVFFLGRKAEKAEPPAERRITAAEVKQLEAAHADWGLRADFWIAEFDRAREEQDLLAEEVARESMEFLLNTRPKALPARIRIVDCDGDYRETQSSSESEALQKYIRKAGMRGQDPRVTRAQLDVPAPCEYCSRLIAGAKHSEINGKKVCRDCYTGLWG